MQLFYSGAAKYNGIQYIASKSLGGWPSSSGVPNDTFENVFSDITQFLFQRKDARQTYLIILKNEEDRDTEHIKLKFFIDDDSYCKYKFAIVSPTKDGNGNPFFEKLLNSSALPLYAEFEDIADGDIFNISSLKSKDIIGIWFSREFDKTKAKSKSCQELFDTKDLEVNMAETFEMQISYDYVNEQSTSQSQSTSGSSSTS